jgi:hypothetical protein
VRIEWLTVDSSIGLAHACGMKDYTSTRQTECLGACTLDGAPAQLTEEDEGARS